MVAKIASLDVTVLGESHPRPLVVAPAVLDLGPSQAPSPPPVDAIFAPGMGERWRRMEQGVEPAPAMPEHGVLCPYMYATPAEATAIG